MKTNVINSPDGIPAAAAAIQRGGLVAVPTETVYGLCANGLDARAVDRIYEVKGRPESKPLSLMVSKAADMRRYCRDIPAAAWLLAEQYWPGPLTIILPAGNGIPANVLAGGDTVGLRCPAHPLTLSLLEQCALPLAAPSANPSGAPAPVDAGEVLRYFDGQIDAVIDGGRCAVGEASTILDMAHTPYRVLRHGAISEEELRRALRRQLSVIGITGGTGSGKTTALALLQERGALIIDCDEVYHRLTESSPALRAALEARFGPVYRDGQLDRRALGSLVYHDAAALEELNAITHRFVLEEVERQLDDWAMNGGLLAAVDAIALLESGLAEKCVFTLGILADETVRAARIMAREGISEEYARARISAQKPDSYYRERCDYILENNGSREDFARRCRAFYDEVL